MDPLTVFGVTALTFMLVMYSLERRKAGFTLAFAAGCAMSSAYGFASGAWPFGCVEAAWTLVALRRWRPAMDALHPRAARRRRRTAGQID
jgi:hypothetical protein